MYCIIKVFNGPQKFLTYAVDPLFADQVRVGTIVEVPLQNRIQKGLILSILPHIAPLPYTVRPIAALNPLPYDKHYHAWIEHVAAYYAVEPWKLYQRVYSYAPFANKTHRETAPQEAATPISWALTSEQQTIVDSVQPFLEQSAYQPSLLHGVTGSGKTAVYQALLKLAYSHNKTSLVLLPEVSLAMKIARVLQSTYGTRITVHEYHYATSSSQKNRLWNDVLERKPIIIIGVRLPIFIPLTNLGLIIVDEEHDAGYQDSSHPRINVKEVALMRAQQYNIPIMLGSATPALTTWHLAQERSWEIFQLLKRFSGAFPAICHTPLSIKKKTAIPDEFWIGETLRQKITQRLARQEQTIIFLNRRGLHKFIQCIDCTTIIGCPTCSVSLTLHSNNRLRCHYCGFEQPTPLHCPSCGVSSNFLKKGIGTQRIVEILTELFPRARIARADIDNKKDQKQWHTTIQAMEEGTIDILVGTQIITKGYNFPLVTLVGIIWAESNFSIPFYTAIEHTLQQLLQVAGRAGRASQTSEVIVQSFIKHPAFSFLSETEYQQFYLYELEQRKNTLYPPCIRLSEIEFRNLDEKALEQDAQLAREHIRGYCRQHAFTVHILGPAIPPVFRVKKVYLRKMYLKGASVQEHLKIFHSLKVLLNRRNNTTTVFFTPNPLQ